MKTVIVCEKPSQARNCAKALLGGKMSGVLDGTNVEIVPLLGHLYEFKEPKEQVHASLAEKYSSWKSQDLPWQLDDIAWEMKKMPKTSDVISKAKAACKVADEIVCATDDDPGTHEGTGLWAEFIIMNKLTNHKLSRMYFEDESAKSFKKAWDNRVAIPDILTFPEWTVAYLRKRWDWLSMQWTRLASECSPIRAVLRQGRLKSAMVRIVGEQLDAIKNYKKIPFYQNKFKDENGIVYTNPEEPVFPKKEDVPNVYSQAHVVVDSKDLKYTKPPKLMDLATLSARLAPKGISAKQVLSTYQKMYEAQVVSYPRTEDKLITQEQFDELAPKVDKIAALVGVDTKYLTHRQARKSHVGSGMAHGANRPGPNVPASLVGLDNQFGKGASEIYQLLAKNFLAMFAEDYEYEHQSGHLQEYPKFVGSANIMKSSGWKAIYSTGDDDESDDSKGLGTIADPFIYEGFPPKPSNPTMRWLMKQLEKYEVGTGATRTSTYADVTSKSAKYPLLSEKRGQISMTEYGEASYRLLPGTHIGDLGLTVKLFEDMAKVEKGQLDPNTVLREVETLLVDDIPVMRANADKLKETMKGQGMEPVKDVERVECEWEGVPRSFKREWCGHRFDDSEVAALVAGETIIIPECVFKSGKVGKNVHGKLGLGTYNGNEYLAFQPDFSAFPEEWLSHKFSDEEASLLKKGETVYIEGLVGKKGKPFNANVSWKDGNFDLSFD